MNFLVCWGYNLKSDLKHTTPVRLDTKRPISDASLCNQQNLDLLQHQQSLSKRSIMQKHVLLLSVSMLVLFSSTRISFSQAPGPANVSFTFRGDINEDSQVNIFDLLEMLKMLADPEGQLTRTKQIADMDVNSAVNIFDLLGLLKVLSGVEEPGIIYWRPSIARIIPSMVAVGDTINIETENFDESTTAADVKAYINTNEVNLLEFTLDNIKIIIPEWFTGGELTLTVGTDTTNSVYLCQGITLVSILPDSFQMGSESGFIDEKPVHNVTVSDFQMSACEITNAQYSFYLNAALAAEEITATSSSAKGATGDYQEQEYLDLDSYDCRIDYIGGSFVVYSGYENRPVVEVTWFGAKSFALRYGFDLPREAEWEYACRGGKQYEYGGNSPSHDPTGPESGSLRVRRGGSWASPANSCLSANRGYIWPSSSSDHLGFRVVHRP